MGSYYFKQAIGFEKHNFKKEANFAGVRFSDGKHHEVPKLVEEHPQFQKFIEVGLVVPSEKMKVLPKAESIDERNKRLAAKLLEKKEELKAIPEASDSEESEELPESADEKPAKKKGKK